MRSRKACVAAVLVAATAITALAAPSAGAYNMTRSGYTGYVEVPPTYGHESWAYGGQIFMAGRKVCTTTAYRGTQTVQVTYRNWKWLNGRWTLYGYHPYNYGWKPTLTTNYRATNSCFEADGVHWLVVATSADTAGGSNGGYFSTDVIFKWYKRSTGAFLGRKYVDYNGQDFYCDTNLPGACATGNGWVWLRGFSS